MKNLPASQARFYSRVGLGIYQHVHNIDEFQIPLQNDTLSRILLMVLF